MRYLVKRRGNWRSTPTPLQTPHCLSICCLSVSPAWLRCQLFLPVYTPPPLQKTNSCGLYKCISWWGDLHRCSQREAPLCSLLRLVVGLHWSSHLIAVSQSRLLRRGSSAFCLLLSLVCFFLFLWPLILLTILDDRSSLKCLDVVGTSTVSFLQRLV